MCACVCVGLFVRMCVFCFSIIMLPSTHINIALQFKSYALTQYAQSRETQCLGVGTD